MKVLPVKVTDRLYLVAREDYRLAGACVDLGGGWWRVRFGNGTERRMWQPDGDPGEVARRAFGR